MNAQPPLWAKAFIVLILVLIFALIVGALVWGNIALWSHIR